LPHGGELTLDVFNLFDRRVNDIEYFYESRLKTEAVAIADRHVHPAEPRTLRLTLKIGLYQQDLPRHSQRINSRPCNWFAVGFRFC
jgi:hypothetical protein